MARRRPLMAPFPVCRFSAPFSSAARRGQRHLVVTARRRTRRWPAQWAMKLLPTCSFSLQRAAPLARAVCRGDAQRHFPCVGVRPRGPRLVCLVGSSFRLRRGDARGGRARVLPGADDAARCPVRVQLFDTCRRRAAAFLLRRCFCCAVRARFCAAARDCCWLTARGPSARVPYAGAWEPETLRPDGRFG